MFTDGLHSWEAPGNALLLRRMRHAREGTPTLSQNYITHVAFVLDASSSMEGHADSLIRVVDNQTKFLAEYSSDQDHETRVTVYVFSDPHNIKCIIYDKDVLRLPSIATLYQAYGNTALLDATGDAIEDLKLTAQKYGDHSFLLFAFTDGEENQSRRYTTASLNGVIAGLPSNWTVAALVPNVNGKLLARRYGFPDGNISIWDATSKTGVEQAGQVVNTALSSYMNLRSTGVSGTRTLFSTSADVVNAQTIKAAGLKPLAKAIYDLITVPRIKTGQGVLNRDKKPVRELSEFVKDNGLTFRVGRNYYRLDKKEMIKGDKEIAVREKATNRVFVGAGVRALIGLSDKNQSVAADFNPDYDIFVQSKSSNRHLFAGNEIMVIK